MAMTRQTTISAAELFPDAFPQETVALKSAASSGSSESRGLPPPLPPPLPSSISPKSSGSQSGPPPLPGSLPSSPMRASGEEKKSAAESPPSTPKKKKRETTETRARIIEELIQTEETYVTQLKLLHELFVEPLQTNGYIKPEQIRVIFSTSNLMSILTLNTQLLETLKTQMQDFDYRSTCIGKPFLQFVQYLKMYQNYMNNHESATKMLSDLRARKPKFDSFLDKAAIDDRCKGLKIESFIILPIQRIPRYELFFRELMKNTGSEHADYADLDECFEAVSEINSIINSNMKAFDSRMQVQDVERRTAPRIKLIAPARTFIREGRLTKVSRKKDIKYNFVLFSDLLLYCASTEIGTGPLKVHGTLPFDRYFDVVDIPNGSRKYGHSVFEIHSTVKSFLVVAESPSSKMSWYKCMRELLDIMTMRKQESMSDADCRLKKTQPVWFPDDFSEVCMLEKCRKKFSFTRRRHHCRYCGKIVCGDCSTRKLPNLNEESSAKVRVCDFCFLQYRRYYELDESTQRLKRGRSVKSIDGRKTVTSFDRPPRERAAFSKSKSPATRSARSVAESGGFASVGGGSSTTSSDDSSTSDDSSFDSEDSYDAERDTRMAHFRSMTEVERPRTVPPKPKRVAAKPPPRIRSPIAPPRSLTPKALGMGSAKKPPGFGSQRHTHTASPKAGMKMFTDRKTPSRRAVLATADDSSTSAGGSFGTGAKWGVKLKKTKAPAVKDAGARQSSSGSEDSDEEDLDSGAIRRKVQATRGFKKRGSLETAPRTSTTSSWKSLKARPSDSPPKAMRASKTPVGTTSITRRKQQQQFPELKSKTSSSKVSSVDSETIDTAIREYTEKFGKKPNATLLRAFLIKTRGISMKYSEVNAALKASQS